MGLFLAWVWGFGALKLWAGRVSGLFLYDFIDVETMKVLRMLSIFGLGKKKTDAATGDDDGYAKLDPNLRKEVLAFVAAVEKAWGFLVNHPSFSRSPLEFQLKTFCEKFEREAKTNYPVLAAFSARNMMNINRLMFDGMQRNKLVGATKLLAAMEGLGRQTD